MPNNIYYRWLTLTINPMGDAEMTLYTDTPVKLENVSVTFINGTLHVSTGISDCCICVSSVADHGASFYACIDSVSSGLFTNVNDDCYLCVSKSGYIPYIARVGSSVYIQNETISSDLPVFFTNTFVGSDVTSDKAQGPVVLESGKLTNTSSGKFEVKNGFEVRPGAQLDIRKP